ncbi:MAG: T9SS type A sorting domain-containing protein [Bacteroidales bacterium]|nr:T9SS type A sorting domain-containing protein [Bacteroidales bacterium]
MKSAVFIMLIILPSILHSQVINYSWPGTIPASDKYSVKVKQTGTTYNIHTHYSEPNLKQGPDGDGVTGLLEDRSLSFATFAFTGTVDVEVTKIYGTTARRVDIQPKTYGINPYFFDGRTVKFKLIHRNDGMPLYISVRFESDDNRDDNGAGGYDVDNAMMIFADKPETNAPLKTAPGVVVYSNTANLSNADIIFFDAGDYNLKQRYSDGVLRLTRNNQRVYISGGAFIRGAVHGEGYDGVWVYGRGIITGMDMYWHEIVDDNGVKDAFMNFMGSNDARFDGFIVHNPTHHTIPSSLNTTVRNIKIIGWASNHDGIRPSGGSTVEQVFIKTCDDYDYARDQHNFKNSVIWPMRNGAFGQLGWNDLGTGFTTYKGICFINSEWVDINKRNIGVIGSVLQQGANISSDTVANSYCEDNQIVLSHLTLQHDPNDPFDPADPGEIHHFVFKNIIFEKPFTGSNGNLYKNPIRGFEYNGVKATIHDISFVNLVLGNRLVTQANFNDFFDIDPSTTYNITFSQEGEIHYVTATAGPGGNVSPTGNIPTPAGMTRTVDIIPDEGYRIKRVLVDGAESQTRIQHAVFSNISGNHTLLAEFEPGPDHFDFSPPVGINESHSDDNIMPVYPNPVRDFLTVDGIGPDSTVYIISMSGEVVKVSRGNRIDVSDISNGQYILVTDNNLKYKIIKQ